MIASDVIFFGAALLWTCTTAETSGTSASTSIARSAGRLDIAAGVAGADLIRTPVCFSPVVDSLFAGALSLARAGDVGIVLAKAIAVGKGARGGEIGRASCRERV